MALPAEFSLLQSEFNEFLFATVGEDRVGVPLSVLSALTRLDVDPWLEAARLSGLPREFAIATLSGMITRLPMGGWEPSETRGIAARLIELLPRGASAGARPANSSAVKSARVAALWLLVLAVGAAAFLALAAGSQLPWFGGHVPGSLPGSHPSEQGARDPGTISNRTS
jgi:hypothetical protein